MLSMAKGSDSKLNQLHRQLPEGFLADAAWLEHRGYSSALRSQYVKAGWLNRPAGRVYRRSHGPLKWEQVVTSLQVLLDYPLTVGGRTALEAQGYGHYLFDKVREVHLYGPTRPPTWLDALPLDEKFRWHNSRRLFPNDPVPERNIDPPDYGADSPHQMPGRFMVQHGGQVTWPIRYSTPERAILELLDELPDHESFQQADALMESLPNLRPSQLQALLENCASVKVKRLFFYFADRNRHAWLAKLEASRVDLGAGKRVLAKGGKLDARYQITVPGDLDGLR